MALPVAALATSLVMEYRKQRSYLVDQAVEWERQRLRVDGARSNMRSEVLESIAVDLDLALSSDVATQGDRSHMAQLLREVSRGLWSQDAEPELPRLTVRMIVIAAMREHPFVIRPAVAVWFVAAVAALIRVMSFPFALLQALLASALLWAALTVGQRVHARWPVHPGLTIAGTLLVAWTLTSPLMWVIFQSVSAPQYPGLWINSGLFLVFESVLLSIAVSAVTSGEKVLARLQATVSNSEISTLAMSADVAEVNRELAIELHGPVQSRLTSAASVLDGLTNSGTPAAREAIAAALAFVRANETPAMEPVLPQLDKLRTLWAGVVNVSVTCPEDLTWPNPLLGRVVDEAISNAYRHGQAGAVRVDISPHSTGVLVQVSDDGGGVADHRTAGLGCRLYASLGEWTLNRNPGGGSVLSINVPMSPNPGRDHPGLDSARPFLPCQRFPGQQELD